MRILIPLDGSVTGESALHYVEKLASTLSWGPKVEVTLFHVAFPGTYHRELGGAESVDVRYAAAEMERHKKKAMDYLDKAGERLRSAGAIVECKVVVSQRDVSSAAEIIKAEQETKADLIAMSTHGRRGLTKWAFGGVTDKVLHGGTAPVLMVRATKEGTTQ